MPRLPEDPKDLAAFSVRSWNELDSFYGFWTERWKRVMDYLRSLHWRTTQLLDEKQIPEWRRFPIVPFTLALNSDYLSQWLQSRVRFSALPDSPDPSEVSAAELADHVLKYLWDKLELDSKKVDLGAWLIATGNGDLRVFWNNDTGDMIPLAIQTKDGTVPVNPQTLQPDPSMKEPVMVDAGEIGLEVVPPQLVRWPISRSKGVMTGYLLSYDDALQKYGKDLAGKLNYGKVQGALSTDLLSIFPTQGQATQEEVALVIEHQLRRSTRFPGGQWWTVSANKQMLTPPMPLPARDIGIVHFRWIPLPGHPTMGITPLHDITYLNKNYDELLAKTLEWLNKVVPKRIRKAGDSLKYGEANEEPGQELVVPIGAEPEWDTPPQPPEAFYRSQQDVAENILFGGGYKLERRKELPAGEATSRFRAPPRQQNEGQQVMLAVINSKPAWQRLGYLLLDYVAKFYTEPRAVSVVGADRTYQWREFRGSELANLPASIHVDELPLYTWNRQSLKDTVIAVLGSPAGQVLFADADGQLDRERINAAMDAVGIDVSSDTLDPDVLEARNENHAFRGLRQGMEPPQVAEWQNHKIHSQEHTRELKGMSYRGWDPTAQEAFLEHIKGHEQLTAQAQQSAQQAMLEQEKSLREIRAVTEMQQDVRTELGKKLVEALISILSPETPPKKESK